eukprot:Sdes_comp15173_c0_seq2m3991
MDNNFENMTFEKMLMPREPDGDPVGLLQSLEAMLTKEGGLSLSADINHFVVEMAKTNRSICEKLIYGNILSKTKPQVLSSFVNDTHGMGLRIFNVWINSTHSHRKNMLTAYFLKLLYMLPVSASALLTSAKLDGKNKITSLIKHVMKTSNSDDVMNLSRDIIKKWEKIVAESNLSQPESTASNPKKRSMEAVKEPDTPSSSSPSSSNPSASETVKKPRLVAPKPEPAKAPAVLAKGVDFMTALGGNAPSLRRERLVAPKKAGSIKPDYMKKRKPVAVISDEDLLPKSSATASEAPQTSSAHHPAESLPAASSTPAHEEIRIPPPPKDRPTPVAPKVDFEKLSSSESLAKKKRSAPKIQFKENICQVRLYCKSTGKIVDPSEENEYVVGQANREKMKEDRTEYVSPHHAVSRQEFVAVIAFYTPPLVEREISGEDWMDSVHFLNTNESKAQKQRENSIPAETYYKKIPDTPKEGL